MKTLLLPISFAVFLLAPTYSLAELSVFNWKPYADRFIQRPIRPYSYRISAMVPAPCSAPGIRSANSGLPGDYFWPAFASFPPAPPEFYTNSIKRPTVKEKAQIMQFLKGYFPGKFQDSALIDSAQTYSYRCLYTADSIRHEFYLMLSEGDTIYVISGWFGKFISFYRAVPSDKKLTPAEFIAQVKEIAPMLGKLGISDTLVKIDTSKVWDESNERLYFLEAYNKPHHLRLRHYPINVVLPPADPKTGKEKRFNLIEISKMNG